MVVLSFMPERSLQQKSKENIESADLLVDNGYFDASVHCSYYGCLQLMKLTIKKVGNIDFKTQHIDSRDNGGSHIYIVNTFKSLFTGGKFKVGIEKHTNAIKKLKELRVQADYDPERVDSLKSRSAVSLAQEFSTFIFEEIKIKI